MMSSEPPDGRRPSGAGRPPRPVSYRITPWTPADRDEVIALIVGIQRGEFGLPITAADQPDLTDVAGFYQAGGGEFWVARHDGPVVGTIAAIDIGDATVALRKMFVTEAHRGGTGLAAHLMGTLVAWARDRGVRTLYLGTIPVMSAAHRFYERHGYTLIEAGELPASFPRMGVDTRFYRKDLAPPTGPRAGRGP
jgi:GNAT superfamily N-acetyltransferase